MNDILEMAKEELAELAELEAQSPEREFTIAMAAIALIHTIEFTHPELKKSSSMALGYLLSEIECDQQTAQDLVARIAQIQNAATKAAKFDVSELMK